MENYKSIEINGTEYYLAKDIHDFNQSFFRGCNNNVRNLVAKKKIPPHRISVHDAYKIWIGIDYLQHELKIYQKFNIYKNFFIFYRKFKLKISNYLY